MISAARFLITSTASGKRALKRHLNGAGSLHHTYQLETCRSSGEQKRNVHNQSLIKELVGIGSDLVSLRILRLLDVQSPQHGDDVGEERVASDVLADACPASVPERRMTLLPKKRR